MSHQGIAVLLGVVLSGGVGLGVEAVGSGAPDVGVVGGVEFLGVESLGASGEAFDAPVVLSGILAWGRNRDCRTHHIPQAAEQSTGVRVQSGVLGRAGRRRRDRGGSGSPYAPLCVLGVVPWWWCGNKDVPRTAARA